LDRAERTAFISFLSHAGLAALTAPVAFASGSAAVLGLSFLLASGLAASGLALSGRLLSSRARRPLPAALSNLALLLVGVGLVWAAVALVLASPAGPRALTTEAALACAAAAVALLLLARRELSVGWEADSRGLIAVGRHSAVSAAGAALAAAALVAGPETLPFDRPASLAIAALVALSGLGFVASAALALRAGRPAEAALPVRLGSVAAKDRRWGRRGVLRARMRRVHDALFHPAHRWATVCRTACALLAMWALSSVSIVGAGRVALVSGRGAVREAGPGVHAKLPWPIERAELLDVGGVRRAAVGGGAVTLTACPSRLEQGVARLAASAGFPVRDTARAARRGAEDLFLTGDGELVAVEAAAHYDVRDPAAFARALDPDAVIERALRAEVAAVMGAVSRRRAVGGDRRELERAAARDLERSLRALGLGVAVQSVEFLRVLPPAAAGALGSAASARDEAERIVVEEAAGAARALADARTEAAETLAAARRYEADRARAARAEAARFAALAPRHRQGTSVTETALTFETIEALLAGADKWILGAGVALEGHDPAPFDSALGRAGAAAEWPREVP